MSYPYFSRSEHVIGPAVAKYYDEGIVLPDLGMVCEPGLRYKISKAASHLFFLKPHSIILSQIESKPLSAYYDASAYRDAALLYFGGSNPGRDLLECKEVIASLRRQ